MGEEQHHARELICTGAVVEKAHRHRAQRSVDAAQTEQASWRQSATVYTGQMRPTCGRTGGRAPQSRRYRSL